MVLPAALPFPNIDPVLFEFGPFLTDGEPWQIHWYGVGYVVGILFAWWYAQRLLRTPRLWAPGKAPFGTEVIEDLLLYAAIGIVLGGRLVYVLFYYPEKYLPDPAGIFAVWDGGMSFHGGFLGCTLAMVYVAWKYRANTLSLFDVIAAGAPIGIGLVRITNFINQELWGSVSRVPWAVVFPKGGPDPRHPSQIYEALLEGFVLFLILRVLTHRFLKLRSPGFVAGAFVAWYGCARIFVEFFRLPDVQRGYLAGGWLTMGMALSVPMVLAGLWLMFKAKPAPADVTAAQ